MKSFKQSILCLLLLVVAGAMPLAAQDAQRVKAARANDASVLIEKRKAALRHNGVMLTTANAEPSLRLLPSAVPLMPLKPVVPMAPRAAGQHVPTFYGNAVGGDSYAQGRGTRGVVSFSGSPDISFTSLNDNSMIFANGGGIMYDNVFHYLYVFSFNSFGMDFSTYSYYEYGMDTWQETRNATGNADMIASDMTYDETTHKVYGAFYDSGRTSQQLGTIDFSSLTVNKIGSLGSTVLVGIAANTQGQLYGIGTDGNLYTIDKTTAALSLVGPTGLRPSTMMQGLTFDAFDDQLYWTAYTSDKQSYLCSVNVQTGAATPIGQLPDNTEIICLYCTPPAAERLAPSEAENLTARFDNGQTTGTVAFRAPRETFNGSPLTSTLDYTISVNGVANTSGTVEAGDSVNTSLTTTEGSDTISVVLSNDAGQGPATKTVVWVGPDTPGKAQNVRFDIDRSTQRATLTWDAPATGVHGGYVDPQSLRYRVVRYPGQVVVAENTADRQVSEVIPVDEYTAFSYGVTATSGSRTGAEARSNEVMAGPALQTPYVQEFNDSASFSLMTIIDGNNDGYTWKRDPSYEMAIYSYNADNNTGADDWLLTPPIHLKTDRTYTFSFQYRCGFGLFTERIAAGYGLGGNPSMFTSLMPTTTVNSDQWATFTREIKVTMEGNYQFGIHCLSQENDDRLCIDNVRVVDNVVYAAPQSATDFTVTPAAEGGLSATLRFTLPTKNSDDTQLDQISQTVIERDNVPIDTLTGQQPGQAVSYTDLTPSQGLHQYSVYCYNGAGRGAGITQQAYIGTDVPLAPTGLHVQDQGHQVALDWQEPGNRGSHDGFVDTNTLTYNIYSNTTDGTLASNLSSRSYVDTSIDPSTGDQGVLNYRVSGVSTGGEGQQSDAARMLTGAPVLPPIHDSFAGGNQEIGWWGDYTGSYFWGTSSDIAGADGDNGCIWYAPGRVGDQASLNSMKIDLRQAAHPELIFSYLQMTGNATLAIEADMATQDTVVLKTIDFNNEPNTMQFQRVRIPLDAAKAYPYVVLKFHATGRDTQFPMVIDDINVRDTKAHDLQTWALSAPDRMHVDETSDVAVRVQNVGSEPIDTFSVRLLGSNGRTYGTMGGGRLESLADTIIYFEMTPNPTDPESLRLHVVAEYALDDDASNNNSDTVAVTIKHLSLPSPDGLTGQYGDTGVSLSWTAPQNDVETIVDDFEDYSPWANRHFGGWISIDGDQDSTFTVSGLGFPHVNEPNAFMVFDNHGWTTPSFLVAHSGYQLLTAFNSYLGPTSDWLLSPTLSGDEQVVSVWMKSLHRADKESMEKVQILYSTDEQGADTTSYQLLNTIEGVPYAWTEFSIALPAGAKHFAIHDISNMNMCLEVDDVTYQAGHVSVAGYNVYRDGRLIASLPATATSYTDAAAADGDHTYVVTATYESGESDPSNQLSLTVDYISGLSPDAAPVDVYTLDGVLVRKGARSLKGLHPDVYIVNGRKVTIGR